MEEDILKQALEYNRKNKRFAVAPEDVIKLSSESGCDIKLMDRDHPVLVDDDAPSDYESDESLDDGPKYVTKHTKLNDLKHEYLSMVLNANRDPMKPGPEEQKTDHYRDDISESYTKFDAECGAERIKEKYGKLGKYDDMLQQQDNPFVEISPGRVYKRKLSHGIETNVTETSVVAYNCALWSEGSVDPFDSTWLRHQAYITDLATDPLLPGLRELLLTCKKNEWCEALIRPEAAFGRLGAMPRIPPNATIFCLIEMIRVVQRDQLPPVPGDDLEVELARGQVAFEDLYKASDLARKRGNYYYEQNQYKAALQRYKSGIRILEAIIYKDESEERKAQDLLLKLYSNCSRTCTQIGSFRLALTFCKEALMLDNTNLKVLYNRMQAWDGLGHPDRAISVARRAMELSKDAKSFKKFERCKQELENKLVKDEKERDNLYRLMGQAYVK